MKKQSLIRIAQVVGGPVYGWPETRFEVEHRTHLAEGAPPPRVVTTPEEARDVADQMARDVGGRVYRGHLPSDWAAALADYPRS